MIFPSLLVACAIATTRVGIVEVAENHGSVSVHALDGAAVVLLLDGESEPLRGLGGCTVEVEGALVGNTLAVRRWSVRDAGDGSGGFVGVLRAYGARLVLDDRNSGGTVILEDATSGSLRPLVGHPVLLIGTVGSAGLIRVVAWKQLDEPAAR